MADLAHGTAYAMNRIEARMQLVCPCQETGSLRETARRWKTSRHTVRKWVCRYEAGGGKRGLDDRGHAAHPSG